MRLLALSVLAACGSSHANESPADAGPADAIETSLLGIYTITEWTRNSTGCDVEGPSVLATETDRFLLLRYHVWLYVPRWIELISCETLQACRAEASAEGLRTSRLGGLFEGSDAAGWTGGYYEIRNFEDTCTVDVLAHTTLTGTSSLEVRASFHAPFQFAPNEQAECPAATAKALASQMPCATLDVLRVTFTEAIP